MAQFFICADNNRIRRRYIIIRVPHVCLIHSNLPRSTAVQLVTLVTSYLSYTYICIFFFCAHVYQRIHIIKDVSTPFTRFTLFSNSSKYFSRMNFLYLFFGRVTETVRIIFFVRTTHLIKNLIINTNSVILFRFIIFLLAI